jgi:hypothetical protein
MLALADSDFVFFSPARITSAWSPWVLTFVLDTLPQLTFLVMLARVGWRRDAPGLDCGLLVSLVKVKR